MRFNCGLEYKPLTEKDLKILKKNELKSKKWMNDHMYLISWRKWFAWYPIRLEYGCCWLEFVERRYEFYQDSRDLKFGGWRPSLKRIYYRTLVKVG